jgi:hypothetical protein
MAYFAKLDDNNKVIQVIAVGNDEVSYNGDPAGEIYCSKTFGGNNWKQTSYNTRQGIYYTPSQGNVPQPDQDQSKAFRHTFAGIGMIYNQERDAFIKDQPYPSWTLKEDNQWQAPITYTNLNGPNGETITYPKWIEDSQKWTGKGLSIVPQDDSEQTFNTINNINCEWNPSTSTWIEI